MPVAVTGIGMICPLGITAPECWNNFLQGKSGIAGITKFNTDGCSTRIGGQLPQSYYPFENQRTQKRLFRQTILATRIIRLCSQEAMSDSGVDISQLDPQKCGAIIGTSGSSVRSPQDIGGTDTERFKIIREMTNASPAWISIENGFKGPSFAVSAACSSGSYAIAKAMDFIQSGVVDFALAGGVDTLLTRNVLLRGNFMKVLSVQNDVPEKAMRPFDRQRDGWVVSDGGCAVALESYEQAIKRNARIYAWALGHGSLSGSYGYYSLRDYEKGMADTMELALSNADLPKEKIRYIGANGISTVVGDFSETVALKNVFGPEAYGLYVSANKSMIGHTVGGSGAITFALTALVLKNQHIPPTINHEFADPDCDLNYVPNSALAVTDLEAAMSNSFGFVGHNCAIVLARSL